MDLPQLSHWCWPRDKKAKCAQRKRELSSWLDAALIKVGRGATLADEAIEAMYPWTTGKRPPLLNIWNLCLLPEINVMKKNRRNQHTNLQGQPRHIRLFSALGCHSFADNNQTMLGCTSRSKYLHGTCDLSVSVGCTWTIFESPVARGVQIWSKADVSSDNRVSACPE